MLRWGDIVPDWSNWQEDPRPAEVWAAVSPPPALCGLQLFFFSRGAESGGACDHSRRWAEQHVPEVTGCSPAWPRRPHLYQGPRLDPLAGPHLEAGLGEGRDVFGWECSLPCISGPGCGGGRGGWGWASLLAGRGTPLVFPGGPRHPLPLWCQVRTPSPSLMPCDFSGLPRRWPSSGPRRFCWVCPRNGRPGASQSPECFPAPE